MKDFLEKFVAKYAEELYLVFRVLVGVMFAMHGGQKLFGWFGAKGAVELVSLMGLAGLIEFFGGLAIAVGLLTRLAALGGGFTMLVAYFKVHFPAGFNPLANGGELALLYFSAFLVVLSQGGHKYSLDSLFLKKE